jgi:hypothetical protein
MMPVWQVREVEALQAYMRDVVQGQIVLSKGFADLMASHSVSYEQVQHACAIVS